MSHSRYAPLVVIAAVVLLLAGPASSGGIRDHQDGFLLRLSVGGGSASSSIDMMGDELKLSGFATDLNFAIGAVVSPNLAIHGTLFGWLVSDPDVEYGAGSAEISGDLSLSAFGGGITYYIMPANVYLSGSIGAGSLTLDTNVGEGETDMGPVIDLTIGKEWWVSDGWGIGAAASLGYHSVPEKGIDENWSGTSFAVRFSATMN
jgi:hypothetical protein